MSNRTARVSGSFRDPSGFLFRRAGTLYRQVNSSYEEEYRQLIESGLYRALVDAGLLVAHDEADVEPPEPARAFKVLEPEEIPFISYPYEWSFSQFKDAALTTLEVHQRAFERGMILKDASAYNVQFAEGEPVHIDTLSFAEYREGEPWVAYRQFCQHFLAPLALMSYADPGASKLLRVYLDGVPLEVASAMLPLRTRLRPSLMTHVHLHARSQRRFSGYGEVKDKLGRERNAMGQNSFLGLIDSLESAVKSLSWKSRDTLWNDYYGGSSNYSPESLDHKKELVSGYLEETNPELVWDLGANVGVFSRIAVDKGIRTISWYVDPGCVETNYIKVKERDEDNLLPLMLDLTNPSPGIGWQNDERSSLLNRGPADVALALALVHHLAISNNTPFHKISDLFSSLCRSLIVEFVPKNDPQVRKLLAGREDVFRDYSEDRFRRSFEKDFRVRDLTPIKDTQRTIYLMDRR